MNHTNNYVIIMAGGVGTRFWPMSRRSLPKQFLDILQTGRTLIQDTFDRFTEFIPASNIYVVTNEGYKDLVKTQLPALNDDQILLEPVGRDTAPCVAYATFKVAQRQPEANFVVAPADHLIRDRATFRNNIEQGLQAVAEKPIIMTLGIKPTRPDTGYGYIQFMPVAEAGGYHQVKTFTEKPDREFAEQFLASGDFLWNGGIFLFSAPTIISAFRTHLSETAELFETINDTYYTDQEAEAIAGVYAVCKPISMDYGIMEKADNVYTIPSEFGWSDLGTWGSIHENSQKDHKGNSTAGNVELYDARNNVVQTSVGGKIVVLKGVENMIVVDTPDALLVCHKDDEQYIKSIVKNLSANHKSEYV